MYYCTLKITRKILVYVYSYKYEYKHFVRLAAKEMFNKFDKKGTGKISTNDIIPAFKSLNMHMNADKIKEWADMLDENGSFIIYSLVLSHSGELRHIFKFL